ncbi:MAG: hypothetical protein H0W34_14765 [Pyrinomonadaceae bacterium]|nr:hypothetical protein [Pyrinomonadaceae bacterium]
MAQDEKAIKAVLRRLPHGKVRFTLQDAFDALEASYREDRFYEEEDDTVIVVAGKFGKRYQARFEVAMYRSFGLFKQLEISLKYPAHLRHLFFKTVLAYCGSLADAEAFFSPVRSSSWFRRYAQRCPTECSIRWRDEDEMSEMFADLLPKMAKGGCFSGVCKT